MGIITPKLAYAKTGGTKTARRVPPIIDFPAVAVVFFLLLFRAVVYHVAPVVTAAERERAPPPSLPADRILIIYLSIIV